MPIRRESGRDKEDKRERAREMLKRERHVYLHVFVALFRKQILQDKVEFRYKEQLEWLLNLEFKSTGTSLWIILLLYRSRCYNYAKFLPLEISDIHRFWPSLPIHAAHTGILAEICTAHFHWAWGVMCLELRSLVIFIYFYIYSIVDDYSCIVIAAHIVKDYTV